MINDLKGVMASVGQASSQKKALEKNDKSIGYGDPIKFFGWIYFGALIAVPCFIIGIGRG